MPKLLSKNSARHQFQEAFACRSRVHVEWIWHRCVIDFQTLWNRFVNQTRSNIGSGRPPGAQAHFGAEKTSDAFVPGAPLGPKLEALARLEASWSLEAVLKFFFPCQVVRLFGSFLGLDFWPQKDSKIIWQSINNPCRQEAGEWSLFGHLLHRNFKIIWRWSQEDRCSKTIEKHTFFLFCHFRHLSWCHRAQRRCETNNKEACKVNTKIIDFWYRRQAFSTSMLEREMKSPWEANLAWFWKPSRGQVAAT